MKMTSEEKKEKVRLLAKERVKEKRNESKEVDLILKDINTAIEKCPDLSLRERDFAFRYAMEYRTYQGWAEFYGCHYGTIQKMMLNPKVRQLISEIRFDIRKYAIGMQTFLMREAMDQYLRIFRAPETVDTMEVKRKTADKIMEWQQGHRGKKDDDEDKGRVHVNIFTAKEHQAEREKAIKEKGAVVVDAEIIEEENNTEEAKEEELDDLHKLEDLQTQVQKYVGGDDAEDHN